MKNRLDIDKRIAQLRKENIDRSHKLLPKSYKSINQKKAFENGLALGKLVSILMARSGGKNPFSKRGIKRIVLSSASYYLSSFIKRRIR